MSIFKLNVKISRYTFVCVQKTITNDDEHSELEVLIDTRLIVTFSAQFVRVRY